MDDTLPGEQEAPGEQGIVEMTDLGFPDQCEKSWPRSLAPVLLAWQRSPRSRPCLRWVSRVGIPLLLITLFSLNNGFALLIRKSVPAPVPRPPSESPRCLVDAAWSPDSRVLAVLGYESPCSAITRLSWAPGVVTLYDTHVRQVVAQLHPDEAIARVLDSAGFFSEITYVHVAWSPDGKLLACTFTTSSAHPWAHPSENGVVLMNRERGHAQVLLQEQPAPAPVYAEWDLARSRSVTFTPAPSALPFMPLSPALAYRWGRNGTLVPETLLTPTDVPVPPPPGPVGNPDGGASFTLWQPGSVDVTALADSARLSSWSTSFVAWSPDGRYLVDGMTLFGWLNPPGQRLHSASTLMLTRMDQVPTLMLTRMDQVPLLPLRDRALLEVADTATAVAWSPSGRILAASQAGKRVELYECRTGSRLAALVLPDRGKASFAAPLLRWSPDGSHLLVASLQQAMTILWEPQAAHSELLSLTNVAD